MPAPTTFKIQMEIPTGNKTIHDFEEFNLYLFYKGYTPRPLIIGIYMQSNEIHEVFNERVYSSRMLARQVSHLTGPSSGAF